MKMLLMMMMMMMMMMTMMFRRNITNKYLKVHILMCSFSVTLDWFVTRNVFVCSLP